ncbi:MAG: Zinc ABC transporter, inner membrane permease protein ZnuB [uncultured Campylobacterales bacterium]|uniref:Zinc ABC transporter, inner membrane permease protein ZnuB n=1 Tax=uncultured Campylobacterales bacterium TaxID=352960 RepID=A0A6S6S7Y2_9BACT|nr:MAG: Zinc ABC transporter, inner membrane permease protein ZnuB [uncultured Campylobacterales bacterium]
MMEVLSYEFMQNAIIGGIIVSFICGIVGTLVVVNKMMFISSSIAHSAYGGIGIAIFFGIPIILGASVFSIILASFIAYITYNKPHRLDTYMVFIWTFGMALGIILIDLSPQYNIDFMSFLFGSILTISVSDIYVMSGYLSFLVLFVLMFYRYIICMSYDMEFSIIRGMPTKIFYFLLIILICIAVILSIQIVGLILIMALFTIPSFIAQSLSSSLFKMMVISTVLNIVFVISGLVVSYVYNIPTGACIILIASVVFLLYNLVVLKK